MSNEYSIQIIDNDSFKQFFIDLNENNLNLDIIIFQRAYFGKIKINLDFVKSLFKKIKDNNIKIFYDIDDDLLGIDETHIDYDEISKLRDIYKFIIMNSDLITVSTSYLKGQLMEYNENIIIIPNTLMKLWNFNPHTKIKKLKTKKSIKIGYFGTLSHGEDIKLLENAINNVKNHFLDKEIIFEVVGVCPESYKWITKINIPRKYNIKLPFKDNIKSIVAYSLSKLNLLTYSIPYPNFVSWMNDEMDWDVAVAPLENSNINKSKSNLKYLEYTALNIPGVYSNVGPYTEISETRSGLVVNNTTKEWKNALISLIEDDELYKTVLCNAREDVEKNYQCENSVQIWKNIFNNY